jgi:hypothetical protein
MKNDELIAYSRIIKHLLTVEKMYDIPFDAGKSP